MKPMRSDEQLIDTFLTGEKKDSETAFEMLITRHGPMVLGVCRHVLRRDQDTEDAFQATFLALARKATTIHNRAILGCWLHEVAYRTALRARERRARSTPRLEIQEVEESHSGPEHAASRNELRQYLRAEVDGLPAELIDRADRHVRIPMLGMKHSLNVSTAGGIVMYELLRKYRRLADCLV